MEQTNEKNEKKSKTIFSKIASNKKNSSIEKDQRSTNFSEKKQHKEKKDEKKIDTNLTEILAINDNTRPAEYYDLPYRYNETIIKILAQTPHSIYIYWDISDNDRKNFEEKYGKDFFYKTKPVLLVHNQTQNYSFEIEIDDFTNSWYLRTPTSNCKFIIELGRKNVYPYETNVRFESSDNRLHISSSNIIESPNDHILKDTLKKPLLFKNIKTNELEEKYIDNLSVINKLYTNFNFEDEFTHNPSSNFKI